MHKCLIVETCTCTFRWYFKTQTDKKQNYERYSRQDGQTHGQTDAFIYCEREKGRERERERERGVKCNNVHILREREREMKV